ncbi:class I SAM-dependent methyltransferase [Lacticaseibacillus saniviri]|nr:class I SAM-dependent methyltransferase [Lacticaseibacillus saniviri]MCG4280976.1 class I SAM-dependent methyltransferase [Lacticaseibacillus saniviri]
MDYISANKAAWEEAFDHRRPHWGDDVPARLQQEHLPFLDPAIVAEVEQLDLKNKTIAQFCCNNGRELLSLMQLGATRGVGFDIADNILAQARTNAAAANITNCEFVSTNILEIPAAYHEQFDLIIFTIGAITWFEDLKPLFAKVADCLKPGGILLLHDFHPLMNMLPLPGEADFKADDLSHIAYPYFKPDPFIENDGISYIAEPYKSKTLTSFAHPISAIINNIIVNGMQLTAFNEYDYDVGLTDVYDGKGYPLSFLLEANKLI